MATSLDVFPSNVLWESFPVEHQEMDWALIESEFWSQIQYDAERSDLLPSLNLEDVIEDNEVDWRIPEPPEDVPKENIVHHDCMWAGSCDDSVHPSNKFVPADLICPEHIALGRHGRRSLLKREVSPPRPDTPPSIDGDEPPQFRHAVDVAGTALRLLRDSAAVAADHSYTLARQHFDNLGVQTPSDSCESEEEIDVVSLGAWQQPLVIPTQYSRPETVSRDSLLQERHVQRPVSTTATPRPAARKRLVPPASVAGSSRGRNRGPGRRGRRSHTDTDSEAESPDVERRSIHNDMERLRRIGLRNLFDELKKQIPATRDKERAPKVVILREATALCRRLRQEDAEKEHLKKQQNKLLTKLKKLRTAAAVARSRPY